MLTGFQSVLLTRPYDDSLITARELSSSGCSCLIDPMLTVEYLALKDIRFQKPTVLQACILTSKRAINALAMCAIPQRTPIFVVGPATAAAVQRQGYDHIIQGQGDGAGLLPELHKHLQPSKGTIIYFSGEETRFDFIKHLHNSNYDMMHSVVYRTQEASHLQVETIDALQHNKIRAILYYSPKSARRFNELALNSGCSFTDVVAVCLSAAVADELTLLFADKVIAEQPHEQAMLVALKNRIKI